jgi:antitoxin (DNA-binding transcriptional repressor) of toxin-antitoxin stability system
MQTLSVREMRNKLGSLDKLLAQEKEIIVTRHNIPLARILPVKGKKKRPDHKALREGLPSQEIASEILQRMDRDER